MNFEKIYDKQVKEKFFSDYEFWRWFKDDQAKLGYDQTKQALEKVFLNQNLIFSNYLEFGPGPGTWTKFFLDKKSGANFTLVDISNEMLSLAKQNLSDSDSLNFVLSDFMSFAPECQFDFFFSSRALEYLPDKNLAVKKIFDLLKFGSLGVIITKNPRYLFYRLKRQKVPQIHQGQILPTKLKTLLVQAGFKVSGPYGVTVTVPLLKNLMLDKLFGKLLVGRKFGLISRFLVESYCFKFTKDDC